MSEAGNAVKNAPASKARSPDVPGNRVTELRVSGHLMTLDAGMFCIFHMPGGPPVDTKSGLPGVRISLPPQSGAESDAGVRISTFRPDGWLDCSDGAALVHVDHGPAQVLVTVYQSPLAPPETAPRLQVLRLNGEAVAAPLAAGAVARAPTASPPAPGVTDVVAHVQRVGDVAGAFGSWVGTRGSGTWIEGFGLNPPKGIDAQDLEYQAVLGRGWLSPWIEGGKFCGSRGMALPLLGINVRLKGEAAKTHECTYSATFVDGTTVGPVPAGEACQADSLAALEAIQIVLRPRGAAAHRQQSDVDATPDSPAPKKPAVATRPKSPGGKPAAAAQGRPRQQAGSTRRTR
jgi:hypothetical protein